ncbi:hypothetical protein K8I61_01485 [bacterium]|nr:hypothetical protein [bacterium]
MARHSFAEGVATAGPHLLWRAFVLATLVAVVATLAGCAGDDDDDDDADEDICASRPDGYYQQCEADCSDVAEQYRDTECGADPTGEEDGACVPYGEGQYEPTDDAYADYCECLGTVGQVWLDCYNECAAPCGYAVP